MKNPNRLLLATFLIAAFTAGVANAQFGREGTWMTTGGNVQRSSWVRTDAKITKASLPSGFQFLWKTKLGSRDLTQPLIMDRYIGYQGFRSFAFMGSADGVYAVDTDLNRIEWQKRISSPSEQTASSSCAVAMSANLTLPTTAEFPTSIPAFGGFGRGGAAKSGVGEPYEGAVTLKNVPPPRPIPAAFFQRVRSPIVLYSLTSDGMFHTMYVSNGEEPEPPVKFLPPNAGARGLIVVNRVAYAATGQDCGEAEWHMGARSCHKRGHFVDRRWRQSGRLRRSCHGT